VSVLWIGAGYLGIGAAIAIAAAVTSRLSSGADAVLLVGLWPLWAPIALARHGDVDDPRARALFDALERARASPLAQVLPDPDSARVLAARLGEAGARLADLDVVLARPELDPATVEQRVHELSARGADAAAATAQLRIRTIGQLRALRERYRAELDEAHELIAQLVAQAELVRLQPSIVGASAALVHDLVAQIEGLDELFAHQHQLEEYPPAAVR
jgi:hypothetical protein